MLWTSPYKKYPVMLEKVDAGVSFVVARTGQVHFGVRKPVSISAGADVFGAEMGGNVCKRKFI